MGIVGVGEERENRRNGETLSEREKKKERHRREKKAFRRKVCTLFSGCGLTKTRKKAK